MSVFAKEEADNFFLMVNPVSVFNFYRVKVPLSQHRPAQQNGNTDFSMI